MTKEDQNIFTSTSQIRALLRASVAPGAPNRRSGLNQATIKPSCLFSRNRVAKKPYPHDITQRSWTVTCNPAFHI